MIFVILWLGLAGPVLAQGGGPTNLQVSVSVVRAVSMDAPPSQPLRADLETARTTGLVLPTWQNTGWLDGALPDARSHGSVRVTCPVRSTCEMTGRSALAPVDGARSRAPLVRIILPDL